MTFDYNKIAFNLYTMRYQKSNYYKLPIKDQKLWIQYAKDATLYFKTIFGEK